MQWFRDASVEDGASFVNLARFQAASISLNGQGRMRAVLHDDRGREHLIDDDDKARALWRALEARSRPPQPTPAPRFLALGHPVPRQFIPVEEITRIIFCGGAADGEPDEPETAVLHLVHPLEGTADQRYLEIEDPAELDQLRTQLAMLASIPSAAPIAPAGPAVTAAPSSAAPVLPRHAAALGAQVETLDAALRGQVACPPAPARRPMPAPVPRPRPRWLPQQFG